MNLVAEKFWGKVDMTDSCWLFTGGLSNGYGQFYAPDRKWAAATLSLLVVRITLILVFVIV